MTFVPKHSLHSGFKIQTLTILSHIPALHTASETLHMSGSVNFHQENQGKIIN